MPPSLPPCFWCWRRSCSVTAGWSVLVLVGRRFDHVSLGCHLGPCSDCGVLIQYCLSVNFNRNAPETADLEESGVWREDALPGLGHEHPDDDWWWLDFKFPKLVVWNVCRTTSFTQWMLYQSWRPSCYGSTWMDLHHHPLMPEKSRAFWRARHPSFLLLYGDTAGAELAVRSSGSCDSAARASRVSPS